MNDNLSTETDEHVWGHGKSVAGFSSSENNMSDERKEIIRQALEFDIIDIRTYTGYKGDLMVEIITMEEDVAQSLKKSAETLGLETVLQRDIISLKKLFCITPSNNTYDLK